MAILTDPHMLTVYDPDAASGARYLTIPFPPATASYEQLVEYGALCAMVARVDSPHVGPDPERDRIVHGMAREYLRRWP